MKRWCRSPQAILKRLYQELDEPLFEHDFLNLSYDEPAYDAGLGMPGMHRVTAKVEYHERKCCIPPDLFSKYADLSFWLKPEMNRKGIVVL
jgi:sulfotransferase